MEQVLVSKSKDESSAFKTYKVKLGKKGQFTIPKKIRQKYSLKEKDALTITPMSGGEMIVRRSAEKTPVDRIFAFIESLPPIDWEKAWKEILEERKKEHR